MSNINTEYNYYTTHRQEFLRGKQVLNDLYGDGFVKLIIDFYKKADAKKKKLNNKEYRKYRKTVDLLTNKVAHLVDGVEKRGFKTYHIDHIKSVWWCFKNGISAEVCANVSNLRCIPAEENILKGRNCI